MENIYTIKQVAFILKVHHLTVRRYVKEKKLPAIKIGGNVRIKESDLQNFQSNYFQTKKEFHSKSTSKISSPFSQSDPFWKMAGLGAHLTLPENDKV